MGSHSAGHSGPYLCSNRVRPWYLLHSCLLWMEAAMRQKHGDWYAWFSGGFASSLWIRMLLFQQIMVSVFHLLQVLNNISAAEEHKHQSGLNHVFYHIVSWFGISDHSVNKTNITIFHCQKILYYHPGRCTLADACRRLQNGLRLEFPTSCCGNRRSKASVCDDIHPIIFLPDATCHSGTHTEFG